MIRNENEYKAAVRRLGEQEEWLKQQAAQLEQRKLPKDQIKRVLDPVRCFHEQIKDEVADYERLKRGEFRLTEHLIPLAQEAAAAGDSDSGF